MIGWIKYTKVHFDKCIARYAVFLEMSQLPDDRMARLASRFEKGHIVELVYMLPSELVSYVIQCYKEYWSSWDHSSTAITSASTVKVVFPALTRGLVSCHPFCNDEEKLIKEYAITLILSMDHFLNNANSELQSTELFRVIKHFSRFLRGGIYSVSDLKCYVECIARDISVKKRLLLAAVKENRVANVYRHKQMVSRECSSGVDENCPPLITTACGVSAKRHVTWNDRDGDRYETVFWHCVAVE